jgi:hypothetical protein
MVAALWWMYISSSPERIRHTLPGCETDDMIQTPLLPLEPAHHKVQTTYTTLLRLYKAGVPHVRYVQSERA